MAHKLHILLLNGPNLNLLGTREPEKYGHTTLRQIVDDLTRQADQLNVELSHLQTNGDVIISCFRGNDPNDFGQMLVHETSHGFIHFIFVFGSAMFLIFT